MTQTFIKIGNQKVDASEVTVPQDRTFRDAWVLNNGAIEIDQTEKNKILKGKVKDEAYRRIIALCPEWKQRNLTAQASILAEKGRDNWTAEELSAWEVGEAIWSEIATIRSKSDELEAMDPIPQDYTEDKWWA